MIFKDCIEAVDKFHHFQVFTKKMHTHLTPMFPIITVDPFTKWEEYFMTCHQTLSRGHHYIIVVVEYFTKWDETMSSFSNDVEITSLFIFNQVIARFGVPREISTDHGSHF
jgi:hypothetical protein